MYKILIVEDNKAIQRNLKMLVEQIGEPYVVCGLVTNGQRALEYLNDNEEVDIIVTDIRMPIMDGLEMIKQESKVKRGIKYIIVSGYDEFEYARSAVSLGVSEYLLKPILRADLENALQKIAEQIIDEKERDALILSDDEKQIMLQSIELKVQKDEINSETHYIAKKMMPVIMEWQEEIFLLEIGELIDRWYEKEYTKETLRILLLSMTEFILRNKKVLDGINMVQPVENILLFSDNYLELKKISIELYQELYKKINALHLENSYTAKKLYIEVRNYIDAHLYETMTASDLSDAFHVSSSYVNRIFKKYSDTSPMTYYNQQKMQEACKLLASEKDYKVKDISEALGFQNQHYFSKAFKTYSGCTPREYKEKQNK